MCLQLWFEEKIQLPPSFEAVFLANGADLLQGLPFCKLFQSTVQVLPLSNTLTEVAVGHIAKCLFMASTLPRSVLLDVESMVRFMPSISPSKYVVPSSIQLRHAVISRSNGFGIIIFSSTR